MNWIVLLAIVLVAVGVTELIMIVVLVMLSQRIDVMQRKYNAMYLSLEALYEARTEDKTMLQELIEQRAQAIARGQ